MTILDPTVVRVTERIRQRSLSTRQAYLDKIRQAAISGPHRQRLSCSNLAHGFAACGADDKAALKDTEKPNIAIVTAYNDMLSAHQPFEDFPGRIKQAVREAGAVAQVAGGVPAMCDGVTQGFAGMELSLWSRDVIAMSTAIALSHDMFDGAVCLGVCDKIVPGLLIGALSFGHLPVMFMPAGPMPSGLSNKEKARIRQLYAEGKIGQKELLDAESAAYHAPGTCTFYGTANSNQMFMELMGLHLPGASFPNPGTPLRDALTTAAAQRVVRLTAAGDEHDAPGRDDRRTRDRQRDGRVAGHRRFDQPHPPPGGDRPRRWHRDRLAGFRSAVTGGAALGSGLSQRAGRREPFPRRRRPGIHDRRVARCRTVACRTSRPWPVAMASMPTV